MKPYAIVADSSCDLPSNFLKEKGIAYARMMINYTDPSGKEVDTPASLEWDVISKTEFYNLERNGVRIRTAQVTLQNYLDAFTPAFERGEDVLYIACSGWLSASVQLADGLVRKQLAEKFPERKLVIVDSLRCSMAIGEMIKIAVKMKEEGAEIGEVAKHMEDIKQTMWELGTPESLEYLKRAGRVTGSSAFFGNLFGVKPILTLNEKGENIAKEKAKGRRGSLVRIAELVEKATEDASNDTLYLMEADCKQEDIDLLKAEIEKRVNFKAIEVLPLGPIIGASSGPGTIIVYFRGIPYTDAVFAK